MGADKQTKQRRVQVIAAVLCSAAVALLVALAAFVLAGLHCISGDGGVPYVAADSAAGSVCDSTGDGALITLGLLLAALALLVVVYRLGRGWIANGQGLRSMLSLAIVAAVLPAGTALAFAGSSSDCSPKRQTAWEEWKQAGEPGDPPFDCASY